MRTLADQSAELVGPDVQKALHSVCNMEMCDIKTYGVTNFEQDIDSRLQRNAAQQT
jgi:hypothetical protein